MRIALYFLFYFFWLIMTKIINSKCTCQDITRNKKKIMVNCLLPSKCFVYPYFYKWWKFRIHSKLRWPLDYKGWNPLFICIQIRICWCNHIVLLAKVRKFYFMVLEIFFAFDHTSIFNMKEAKTNGSGFVSTSFRRIGASI